MKRSKRNRPLNKKEISAALLKELFPHGVSPKLTWAERIVAEWAEWKRIDKFVKDHPREAAEVEFRGSGEPKKSLLDDHLEKYDELADDIGGKCVIALQSGDASFFWAIGAAISKQRRKRAKSDRKFNPRNTLLLIRALKNKENVLQLARELKAGGRAESVESLTADLRKRRRKLGLKKLG